MIALALVMMRVRRAHAVTICLLAALAIGAAVAAPLYIETAQRSVTKVDLRAASATDLSILSSYTVLTRSVGDDQSERRAAADRAKQFDKRGIAALTIPGFATVFASGFDINMSRELLAPLDRPDLTPAPPEHWLEYRDGVCQHLTLRAGRCPAADGEVLVGAGNAEQLGLHPGSPLYVRAMAFQAGGNDDPGGGFWYPVGAVGGLSVVGVYLAPDPSDVYFTGAASLVRGGDEPVFTDRRTLSTISHVTEAQRVLAYPTTAALDPDAVVAADPVIRAAVNQIKLVNTQPLTSVTLLLDRIAADRAQVTVLPGVLELPLIILCCFVVFLAAANTAQARRVELGMLKLRGASGGDQFWLASAEIVLPLLVGGAAGYLLGQVAVWSLARSALTVPVEFALTARFLPQAALALLAVVGAGLVGLRRDLATPVADLLRRVPSRVEKWGSVVLRTVVGVLAVAAVVQLRTSDPLDALSGAAAAIATLAPAVLILAFALLFVLGFDPLVARWGQRAVRRGRVGSAMALLHLARRRSGSRVVALITVATGLVGYVAIAFATGTAARHNEVVVSLGADQVVSVGEVSMRQLLNDVRAVDPAGTYAMAVMPVPSSATTTPPVLAVDATRLDTVAYWPAQGKDGLTAAAAKQALRPTVASSVDVRGTGLSLTVDMNPPSAKAYIHLAVVLAPLDGAPAMYVRLYPAGQGSTTYTAPVTCPVGCRLSTLAIADFFEPGRSRVSSRIAGAPVVLTLSSLRQTGPDAELVNAAAFGTWIDRQAAELTIKASPAGALVTVGEVDTLTDTPAWIGPADQPDQLAELAPTSMATPPASANLPTPIISAQTVGQPPIAGARVSGRTTVLPRIGAGGVLVDLEYLTRLSEPGWTRVGGEVWLGPDAPPDAVDRLRAAGLTVLGVRDFDAEYVQASGGPNAVGLQFLLAAGLLCLALGAGGLAVAATVELRARADELRSLRRQGASRRSVGRAARQSYLVMVVAGTGGGAVAAVMAWVLTRDRLPVVDVLVPGVPVPTWPGWSPVWAWLGASGALVLIALLLSSTLSGAIRANGARANGGKSKHSRRGR